MSNIADPDPFRVDPFIFGPLRKRNTSTLRVVMYFLAAEAIIIMVASIAGDLLPTLGWRAAWRDFESLVTNRASPGATGSIPVFQDLAAILLFVSIPLSAANIYRQMIRMSTFHSDLCDAGGMSTFVGKESECTSEIDALNLRYQSDGSRARSVAVACIAFAAFILLSLKTSGSFGYLTPSALNPLQAVDWRKHAYDLWWAAAYRPFRPAGLLYLLYCGAGIYIIVVHTLCGWRYASFMRKTREIVAFTPNHLNPDRYYGWLAIRRNLNCVASGVWLSALSSLAIITYSGPSLGQGMSTLIVGLFMADALVILVYAILFFYRSAAAHRTRSVNDLRAKLPEVPPTEQLLPGELDVRKALLDEIDRHSAIPLLPMRRRTLVWTFLLAAVPLLGAALQIKSGFGF
jgi:hypothetical protein